MKYIVRTHFEGGRSLPEVDAVEFYDTFTGDFVHASKRELIQEISQGERYYITHQGIDILVNIGTLRDGTKYLKTTDGFDDDFLYLPRF